MTPSGLSGCCDCRVGPNETHLSWCPQLRAASTRPEFAEPPVYTHSEDVIRGTYRRPPPPLPPGVPDCVTTFAHGVAAKHGVSAEELFGRNRYHSTVRARHELWAVTIDTLGLSYPEMGRLFRVHHTSVLSAVRKYREART